MTITTKQSAKKVGPRRWKWAVWLDGDSDELDRIDHVTYYLHPTFKNPVRTITGRRSNFRLDSSGWGTFTLGVEVHEKGGVVQSLKHELRFDERPERDSRGSLKRVLLLNESEDSEEAAEIVAGLEQEGVEVTPASALEGGTWSKELMDGIRSMDWVLSIGEAHEGRFRIEAQAAKKLGKQVIHVGTEKAHFDAPLSKSLTLDDLKGWLEAETESDVSDVVLSKLKFSKTDS